MSFLDDRNILGLWNGGSPVSVDDTNPVPAKIIGTVPVTSVDLDIRNLNFAFDKVDASGSSILTDGLTDVQLRASPVDVDTGLIQPTTPTDTQPVSAASLPLPDGAATSAKQLPDNHQVTVSNFPATITIEDGDVSIQNDVILSKSNLASSSGNNVIHTPASGYKIRLWWYNMAANPNNSSHVVASLRFGTDTPFNNTPLSQYGAATAHSFKSGNSYIEGDVDEPLICTLDQPQNVYVNIDYQEIQVV